ncbi:MAG: hypothetical protein K2O01_00775 [Bacteroidales bacterium]|nr:hypothetical protein [Bacteroidales bacterium]
MAWETSSDRTVKRLKNTIFFLIIVILALGGGMGYALYQKQQSFKQGVQLKGELDQLMDDYTSVKVENQDLSAQLMDKDSIIMANAKEIQKLIASQADYNKIKRKLELLRNITQDYVHRIDSLVVENQTLTAENVQIKEEIAVERRKNTTLTQEKQALTHKVEVASMLKAYNLEVGTARLRADGREVPTDKAVRLSRITISFTLGENNLAEKGEKTLYARIERPDGIVITKDATDNAYTFTTDSGQTILYSIKETVNYQGEALPVHIFWDKLDKKQPAMDGKYDVKLYADGKEIGRGSFIVRP